MNKKHWFKLGAVAVALLLIPRRSSRQTQDNAYKHKESSNTDHASQSLPSNPETEQDQQQETKSDL